MSINTANLLLITSSLNPQDDVNGSGGSADTVRRPTVINDDSGLNESQEVLSDNSADNFQSVSVTVRNTKGELKGVSVTLNGVTPVAVGIPNTERVLIVDMNTTATGTITLRSTPGGAPRATLPPGQKQAWRLFINSFSSPSAQTIRYQKVFWWNNDPTFAALAPQFQFTTDSASKIQTGVAATKNDGQSITNRLTAPTGVTFVGINTLQTGPADLALGDKQGVWVKQTLNAGDAAAGADFTLQISVSSI